MSERVLHFPEQQDLWWLLQALHLTFSNLCSSAKQLKKKKIYKNRHTSIITIMFFFRIHQSVVTHVSSQPDMDEDQSLLQQLCRLNHTSFCSPTEEKRREQNWCETTEPLTRSSNIAWHICTLLTIVVLKLRLVYR